MKTLLSAVVVALLLGAAYMLVIKLPVANEYKGCYNTAYQVLNEKHIISKRAYTNDEDICVERKRILISALECFQRVDKELGASEREKLWIKTIAQAMSRGTKSVDEVVEHHHEVCGYPSSRVEFDPRTNTWF